MQQQESTSLAEWTRTTVRTFLASSYLLPSEVKVSLYIYVTCFFAYSATYGIRLPLFVPFYDDYPFQTVLGVETQVKVLFGIALIIGYGAAKPFAMWVVPAVQRSQRLWVLVALMIGAVLPLAGFGFFYLKSVVVQLLCIFLTAFSLSPIWGVMVLYLEGRRWSDSLIVGEVMGVVFSTGASKSFGALLLRFVTPGWMPFVAAVLSLGLFVVFAVLLDLAPDPSPSELRARAPRRSLSGKEGLQLVYRWKWGIVFISIGYLLHTAFRYFRDIFSGEIYHAVLGRLPPWLYTIVDVPAAICLLLLFGSINFIAPEDRAAFLSLLLTVVLASGLLCLLLLGLSVVDSMSFFLGLTYLIAFSLMMWIAYTPPSGQLYDRFMGASGEARTSTFLLLMSDGIGYVGTLTLLVYFNFISVSDSASSILPFFMKFGGVASGVAFVSMTAALIYFWKALPSHFIQLSAEEDEEKSEDEEDQDDFQSIELTTL